jgi:hypothetical protein
MSNLEEDYELKKEQHINALHGEAIETLRDRIQQLEHELRDTRDMARDTLHIAIGVDGKNGLRSAISELSVTVYKIKEDFLFLRETAHNYKELKGLIGKFLLSGVFAFIFQLGGIIWFFSAEHVGQQQMVRDMSEVSGKLKAIDESIRVLSTSDLEHKMEKKYKVPVTQ